MKIHLFICGVNMTYFDEMAYFDISALFCVLNKAAVKLYGCKFTEHHIGSIIAV